MQKALSFTRIVWLLVFAFTALLLLSLPSPLLSPAQADVPEEGTSISNQDSLQWPTVSLVKVAGDVDRPTVITGSGDGSGRLFLVEQQGRIWVLHLDTQEATVFLDIRDRVSADGTGGGAEQGLLGLAFPHHVSPSRHFYVYYTNRQGDNQVSRFWVGEDVDKAVPASEEKLLLIERPGYREHNAGQLAFGPDGYLYIGSGDAEVAENAQNPGTLLGKLLRIQVEATGSSPARPNATVILAENTIYLPFIVQPTDPNAHPVPYAIPKDNPFVDTAGYRPEIWALGLRNPWRFSFDRDTGDLYFGDVGEHTNEEIDFQAASSQGGENYGWPIFEGFTCISGGCDSSRYTMPIYTDSHTDGNCAVIGGYVYRGRDYPELQGIYLFGDYCSGRIWGLKYTGQQTEVQQLADTPYPITCFGEDDAGEIYLADRKGGGIYQVAAGPAPRTPPAVIQLSDPNEP